jgi:hypothetical protein
MGKFRFFPFSKVNITKIKKFKKNKKTNRNKTKQKLINKQLSLVLTMAKRTQAKHNELTLKQKVDVLAQIEKEIPFRMIAKDFKCSIGTVQVFNTGSQQTNLNSYLNKI